MQGMAVHFSKKKNATIDANCSSVDAADYFYTFVWCGYWSSIRQQHKLQAAAVVTKRRGCAGFEALALLFFFHRLRKDFFFKLSEYLIILMYCLAPGPSQSLKP